jgi:hypothetical protein
MTTENANNRETECTCCHAQEHDHHQPRGGLRRIVAILLGVFVVASLGLVISRIVGGKPAPQHEGHDDHDGHGDHEGHESHSGVSARNSWSVS